MRAASCLVRTSSRNPIFSKVLSTNFKNRNSSFPFLSFSSFIHFLPLIPIILYLPLLPFLGFLPFIRFIPFYSFFSFPFKALLPYFNSTQSPSLCPCRLSVSASISFQACVKYLLCRSSVGSLDGTEISIYSPSGAWVTLRIIEYCMRAFIAAQARKIISFAI